MSDQRFRIASDHKIDRARIASLVRIAATNADLKIKSDVRRDVLKMIEEAVKGRIEAWKKSGQSILKSDVLQAVNPLAKDVLEAIKKKEKEDEDFVVELEGQKEVDITDESAMNKLDEEKIDIFGKIIADTLLGYVQGGAIKVSSEQEDLVFASADDAVQYLADLTGDKIVIASDRKPVNEYELRDMGVENSQYFQGAGTSFTDWKDVFVGIGDNLYDAAEDALDNAADTYDVDAVKNDMSKETTVPEDAGDDVYQYVALYVK